MSHITSVLIGPGIPRGVAVVVGPDKRVSWLGPINTIPDDSEWRDGSVLNMHAMDYANVKAAMAEREIGREIDALTSH